MNPKEEPTQRHLSLAIGHLAAVAMSIEQTRPRGFDAQRTEIGHAMTAAMKLARVSGLRLSPSAVGDCGLQRHADGKFILPTVVISLQPVLVVKSFDPFERQWEWHDLGPDPDTCRPIFVRGENQSDHNPLHRGYYITVNVPVHMVQSIAGSQRAAV